MELPFSMKYVILYDAYKITDVHSDFTAGALLMWIFMRLEYFI